MAWLSDSSSFLQNHTRIIKTIEYDVKQKQEAQGPYTGHRRTISKHAACFFCLLNC